ncbi:hypothetical protein H2203_001217 [Taxawa tesnikishii (nom. ined.)]|nr:hypothetical protein H2203_001217 [Dothideales sp. JES 119]
MKVKAAAAAAAAVTGAAAQSTLSTSTVPASSTSMASSASVATTASSSSSTVSPLYVTMTVDDCASETPATMITVTNGVTVTYCPSCMEDMIPHTTIYTTVYEALCTTGDTWSLTPTTYTVTESCTHATPTWGNTASSNYVPQGFTVTETVCTMCGEKPVSMTITEPCGCEATNGVPAPAPAGATPTGGNAPAATGSSSNPGSGSGAAPAPGPGSGAAPAPAGASAASSPSASLAASGSGSSGNGSSPAPAGGAANPPAGGAAAAQPPYPTTAAACPGPACRASASGSPVSSENTSNIEPWTGGAASLGASWQLLFSGIVGVGIAGLAVFL